MVFEIEATKNIYNINQTEVIYINSNSRLAVQDFSNGFYSTFSNIYQKNRQIIILCIGTDRVTGDSLGPIVGYKLNQYQFINVGSFLVYGTLQSPVHAKNLSITIDMIYKKYDNPLIIAIDASLGSLHSIGHVTIGKGKITPGAGVNKKLPSIGDMFVTGIVSLSAGFDSIQNARLGLVMQLADVIFYGMTRAFNKISTDSDFII